MGPIGPYSMRNLTGTVRTIPDRYASAYGIEFDVNIGGHDLWKWGSHCPISYGWFCDEDTLIPIPNRNLIAQDLLKILESNNEEI